MLLKFACNGRKAGYAVTLFTIGFRTLIGSISMMKDVSWWPLYRRTGNASPLFITGIYTVIGSLSTMIDVSYWPISSA